ncbi:hypothetical protein DTL21_28905 [Bremerella cremea]|uniref:Uncharacterized protein n=1 Tax=Blastopirellula marina TaxID=124 RepID=A0A2S8F8X2_9BACT|nr:hypothetical protein C5Y83_28855 [Blastopirellula marina]RCS41984.1 hypothetical protein DTL21_28905 [Bremerella cremea]
MYYRELTEFETMLAGHQYAFQSLGIIDTADGFNTCFRNWIEEMTAQSCARGWGSAIENLAKTKASTTQELFAELADEFLVEWLN